MRIAQAIFATASALSLAACAAVGPNHSPPPVPATAQDQFIGSSFAGVAGTEVRGDWWRLYNDPVLDGLVAQALDANKDIAVATANIAKARAALRGARSDRLPQTNVGAGAQYGRPTGLDRAPGQDSDWALSTGFDVAYEVDLFGRVRRGVEAARADVAAAEAARDSVRVIVAAETARAYADILTSQRRLEVQRRTVGLLEQTVTLAQKRFDAGRTSKLDLVRVSALRDQQRAKIPEFEAELESATFRLATPTGHTPAERPVAVNLTRGPHYVIAMLAVLKAGGVIVPLDPSMPATRRPSIATTSASPPGKDTRSPTCGIRPSRANTYPPNVAHSPSGIGTL